jgi:hypothetical protein
MVQEWEGAHHAKQGQARSYRSQAEEKYKQSAQGGKECLVFKEQKQDQWGQNMLNKGQVM